MVALEERRRDYPDLLGRLRNLEESMIRIEARLFNGGLSDRVDTLIQKLDQHVHEDNRVHQTVAQQGTSLSVLMWLFGILTVGLALSLVRGK